MSRPHFHEGEHTGEGLWISTLLERGWKRRIHPNGWQALSRSLFKHTLPTDCPVAYSSC